MDLVKMPQYEEFDWDKNNIDKNEKKHGIFFKEGEEVFVDDPILYEDLEHSINEKRFQCIGLTKTQKLLFISYTIRDKKIRIISARIASKKERGNYEKTKKNS